MIIGKLKMSNTGADESLDSWQISTQPSKAFFKKGELTKIVFVGNPLSYTRSVISRIMNHSEAIVTCLNNSPILMQKFFIIHFVHFINKFRQHKRLFLCIGRLHRRVKNKGCDGNHYNNTSINRRSGNASENKRTKKELEKGERFIQPAVDVEVVTLNPVCITDFKFDFVAFHCFTYLVLVVALVAESLSCQSQRSLLAPSIGDYLVAKSVYWLFGRASSNRASFCGLV